MPLAEDLKDHARNLLEGSPNEVHLRRSVSAAYYALFHLLSAAVARQVTPALPIGLRERTQRALDHGSMASAARKFSKSGNVPADLPKDIAFPGTISTRLANVAQCFVELQEARHIADYDALDSAGNINLRWAQRCLERLNEAFRDWLIEEDTEGATVFLAALMFAERWNKKARLIP